MISAYRGSAFTVHLHHVESQKGSDVCRTEGEGEMTFMIWMQISSKKQETVKLASVRGGDNKAAS